MTSEWEKMMKGVEKGEARLVRKEEIVKSVGKKLERYKQPWTDLRFAYGQNKGRYFTEENDRFLVRRGGGGWGMGDGGERWVGWGVSFTYLLFD